MPDYAELYCVSNFSFLKGASHPEELVNTAKSLGYRAIAITDECSVAGIVRAHVAAKSANIKLLIGSYFHMEDGMQFALIAKNRIGYGYLCNLISNARQQAEKGAYRITREQVPYTPHCIALWVLNPTSSQAACVAEINWLNHQFNHEAWLCLTKHFLNHEHSNHIKLKELSQITSTPLVATNCVHMHTKKRHVLKDTLTAIRNRTSIRDSGLSLNVNSEDYLRPIHVIESLYPPELLAETMRITNQCAFNLDELKYEYPKEITPPGVSPSQYLHEVTKQGLERRYPVEIPLKVKHLVQKELKLIRELNYEPYFLTVFDITNYARSKNILFQGRGSAANSAVCYALGITEVDPDRSEMLFERFISKERNEPPDIDVDFENDRREEVIQYIYTKYGRHRAALAATVITYRAKSAFRDVGKALGLNLEQITRITKNFSWWDKTESRSDRLLEVGFDPNTVVIKQLIEITEELSRFPRHLSQHVGGFVISEGPLTQLVPIENASMKDRTVIQWDKDDLDALGLLKIDILALGMLSAIKRALSLIGDWHQKPFTISDIPAEDPKVYDMISRADTIGVFQIESRAQMSMLPRLKPKCFYDLVIEVAIVRPGPIQGGMVHPYLERRQGKVPISYPSDAVKNVLKRTLGVPIFQEQVMQLAIVAAGFTPGEADQLRRSMAAWRRRGGLGHFEKKLINGMRTRGYTTEFAQQIFKQILGFGEYGFPESHSASFALLVYVSCWLKYHEPAAFTCALLNSQPMGFYAPSQLIQDAKRHGVQFLPVDFLQSQYECHLVKANKHRKPIVQLGFNTVKGISRRVAERIIQSRKNQSSPEQVIRIARLNKKELDALAQADVFLGTVGDRHRANWWARGIDVTPPPLLENLIHEQYNVELPIPTEGENVIADYRSLGFTLRSHPLSIIRDQLRKRRLVTAKDLSKTRSGESIKVAGIVTCRQRPGTASGVVFVTLEDETGYVNVVIWNNIATEQRRALLNAHLLGVSGHVEREGQVIHVIAKKLTDLSGLLGTLNTQSRDFH